jgi:hypothetical protein
MTIDDQICLLSPNSATIDPSELYKVSHAVSNVLLVGGTYYAKHAGLRNLVNPGFRRDFYENTREKPPSLKVFRSENYSFHGLRLYYNYIYLKGCIAEVRLASQLVDLEDILVKQIHKISAETTADSSSSIFSVEQGCNECPSRCNGASCSIAKNPSDVLCNCASIYALVDVNTGACQKSPGNSESLINAGLASLAAALRLTFIGEIDVYLTPELFRTPLVSQKGKKTVLNKIWMLIRLPELNSKLHTFIRLGDIKISVGNNGKQVVVDLADYGIQEEFSLPEFDGRLHLLSIEKNPSIGTSLDKKLLTIRLDKNERYHELDEIPIYSTSNDELQIYPYALDHDDHGVDGKGGFSGSDRGGCLSG